MSNPSTVPLRISRRSVLAGAGVAAVTAALSNGFAQWAHAAPPLTDGDYETLRQRWIDLLTGRHLIDPEAAVFAAALTTLDASVEDAMTHLVTTPDRAQVFDDQPLTNDALMVSSYTRVATFARAWATPGSKHHQSATLLAVTLDALRDLNRIVYHAGRAETGNWWSWEIGASRQLADAMAIVRDHLSPEEIAAYCAAIDHFVPDPWTQFMPPRQVVTSTGANRVDLCQAVIIRSLASGDTERLRHAVDGLSDTWQYVTSGDGFFRDGSFVQHSTIGYTGTYGVVLLGGLSKLFALLAGSGHAITDPSRSILDQAVEGSYAPLVYRGQMMDSVRGRAVSREGSRSLTDGDAAIEAILRLAEAVEPAMAERWRGLCRQWIEAGRTGSSGHDILNGASIVRTALVHALLSSAVVARPDTGGGRLFPGMDRLVHRGANNRWALTVAMCSSRIAWYECGNGENNLGAQTSAGMTYLYLDTDDAHYDDEFWPTSDLTAPAGTTVDTTPLPPKVEGEWGARCPQNEWTGGSVLDEWSLAAQHLIGPGGTGLTARKTWFATPDLVACLGADITCAPQTATHTVPVSADAHVNDGSRADTPAGASGTLLVKSVATVNSGYTRHTYLRFAPEATPSAIASIALNLHARVNDSGGTTDTVAVYRTGDFNEATLTWNNRPPLGDRIGEVTIQGGFAWRAVDLTASLADDLAAGRVVTLAIVEPLNGRSQGLSVEIKSKEAGSATAPHLSVSVVAGEGGRTRSVVDHRNTGDAVAALVVDGVRIGEPTRIEEPRWAHLPGTGGYVFLAPAAVEASAITRTGSWRAINTGGSTTAHTRGYATLQVLHPSSGRGTYAHLLLPHADEATTRKLAAKPPVTVVSNTAQVQAVTAGVVTAAAFWSAGSAAGLTVERPATVISKRTPGMADVAIADPTQGAGRLVLELADAPWTRVQGSGVRLERVGRVARVTVDVAGRGGVPVRFQLMLR
ncbi:polysaccharide lyase family 8 super-sandwich domain-containing protein [Aestuariimicrobium soli]|uniref:polysaccharide lyase family 8 super-sandwich domain-containing protein n=1 Tax=Aestuariimicrobium soli TaxID=2035834 RepID=UPI003EBF9F5A